MVVVGERPLYGRCMTQDSTRTSLGAAALLPTSRPRASSDPALAATSQFDQLAALIKQETPVPEAATAALESEETGEESLQAYLDRFMERTIGKKSDSTSEPAELPLPGTAVLPEVKVTQPPREPVRPPECRDQIAAMRAVANENAQKAVAQHASRNLSGQASSAFMAAAAVSLLSTILAAASLWVHLPGAIPAALISGTLGLVLSCRFFGFCRQMGPTES